HFLATNFHVNEFIQPIVYFYNPVTVTDMSPVWTRRPLADYRKLFGYRCLLGRDRKINPASISALKTGFQKNELNKIAPF
ncbi:TPA: hypothetical protein ACT3K3_002984, partial [Klebsiella pneumoniae]|uniref:hypothetical protein n=1 Tax=Klebsiella pneumoniae TaxID=573 RepID=UPI001E357491